MGSQSGSRDLAGPNAPRRHVESKATVSWQACCWLLAHGVPRHKGDACRALCDTLRYEQSWSAHEEPHPRLPPRPRTEPVLHTHCSRLQRDAVRRAPSNCPVLRVSPCPARVPISEDNASEGLLFPWGGAVVTQAIMKIHGEAPRSSRRETQKSHPKTARKTETQNQSTQ